MSAARIRAELTGRWFASSATRSVTNAMLYATVVWGSRVAAAENEAVVRMAGPRGQDREGEDRAGEDREGEDRAGGGRVGGDRRTLGELIRSQRELAELSMRQFSSMVGISNPYLSQIERGLREPSERVLNAIADNLHMSADLLTGGDQEDGPNSVVEAVSADPDLTAVQRRSLLETYEAYREITILRRRRPGAGGRPAQE